MCMTCDVVFVGASVPNLLSAIALHERFEGIRIKILEASSSLAPNDSFLTVLSPDAWRLLTELCPHLTNVICNRNLFLEIDEAMTSNSEGCSPGRRCLLSSALFLLLLSELPTEEIQLNRSVHEITETSDTVSFRTQNGEQYKTKILITDGQIKSKGQSHLEATGFVEAFLTSPAMNVDSTRWQSTDLYVQRKRLRSGKETFSCLMELTDISPNSIRRQLQRIPELEEVFSRSKISSLAFRRLSRSHLPCSHGRTGVSGSWSSFIPYFLSLKEEYEFEEALLLIRAIEEKGLTAAAISYWKRCQAASSKTQVLNRVASPLELISTVDGAPRRTKTIKTSASSCRINEVDQRASDVGKPLVCTPVKPYMALS